MRNPGGKVLLLYCHWNYPDPDNRWLFPHCERRQMYHQLSDNTWKVSNKHSCHLEQNKMCKLSFEVSQMLNWVQSLSISLSPIVCGHTNCQVQTQCEYVQMLHQDWWQDRYDQAEWCRNPVARRREQEADMRAVIAFASCWMMMSLLMLQILEDRSWYLWFILPVSEVAWSSVTTVEALFWNIDTDIFTTLLLADSSRGRTCSARTASTEQKSSFCKLE